VEDYALFRALHDEHWAAYWREWEPELRDRDPGALDRARQRLAHSILYYQYLQWLADDQWQRARVECREIGLFGDFPFMVSGHSADVWARQDEFRLDASVGTPPDAFSETGQNWGLPVYRWDRVEATGYEWLRQRARRCAELYDGFRVDHLIGFYRTFVREPDNHSYFTPSDEPSQTAQGERIMRIFKEPGARIIAEDLGLVPDFVRESLMRLHIPGLKVLRWERYWHSPRQPFRHPADYVAESVAISGTHDTDTLAEWWDGASQEERHLFAEIPGVREAGCDPDAPFNPHTRDVLLRVLFSAASNLVIVPIQDLFGWRDRVNVPAVVNDENWTWRLPWPIEDLLPHARERAEFLRALTRETGR
jgi:4-alpha-glucanotransferase